MTLGFVVGKFYPPHRGHKLLIDEARRQVDRLVVMIAHRPSQLIPGEVRAQWLREIHPDVEVRLVADELEDDTERWAAFTLAQLGRAPDVVFSSEDYGPKFARLMGSKHVSVDPARTRISISATKIRAAPPDHLDFLEPCVRAYFVKRVVLIGAESTGKTTLAEHLAAHFHTVWVPEYARGHWERKLAGRTVEDPPPSWTREEFVEIAREQQRSENVAARTANRVLFADTNAFATGTWFERYQNARDPEVDAIGAGDAVDLYLFAAPDAPFVQDGFRDGEKIRGWMDERFATLLAAAGSPVVRIEGDHDARWTKARVAVERLLANHGPLTSRSRPA